MPRGQVKKVPIDQMCNIGVWVNVSVSGTLIVNHIEPHWFSPQAGHISFDQSSFGTFPMHDRVVTPMNWSPE